ncbi:unnamed protein product [Sphagnum jensenii]|uniref:Pentatricopeptide repeat-containing protein n=1 Tax=Sphagnum jensenii TaxID=128206 RepID=A0ABP1BZ78_9BRYO
MAAMAAGIVQLHPFAWNRKLTKYVQAGQHEKAMQLFQQMQQEGMSPDKFTFVQAVKACAGLGSLEDGRLVHEQLIQSGCESDVFLGSSLVNMQGQKALELFRQMQQEGVQPNSITFVGVMNACANREALEEGRCVHQRIIQSGFQMNVFVGNSLVDMYAKCGSIDDAWRVFHKMPSQDVVTWTTMILGHVKCGQGQKALELFQQMQQEGVQPNSLLLG